MARTVTHTRQIVQRALLDQIANKTDYAATGDSKPANATELDNLLTAINDELTAPISMSESSTPDLVLNLGSAVVQNSETSKNRTIASNPDFAGGTVTIPATGTGDIVPSAGDNLAIAMSNSSFLKVLIEVDEDDNIVLSAGAEGASVAAATLPDLTGSIPAIGYFIVRTDGGGNTEDITNEYIYQFVGSGGSGGGGVVQIKEGIETGQTGTTITFSETYAANRKVFFFRNGVLMRRVSAFSGSGDELAFEYQEVDNGNLSTQITLNPNTDGPSSGPAVSDDVFEFRYIQNTFDAIGLAEKTISTARGFADNTETLNCTISQDTTWTTVTLSGFTYVEGISSGQTTGDLVVRVNGQDIEREVAGTNDNNGDINYTEDSSGTFIRIKEVGTGELPDDALIEVVLRQYFVSEIDNIQSDVVPADDGVYDLGKESRVWKDLWVSGASINLKDIIGGDYGTIRRNATSGALEYRPTSSGTFGPLGGGGAGTDILQTLSEAELGSMLAPSPNRLLDSFDTADKGTRSQLDVYADALRFSGLFNDGTYERSLETSTKAKQVDGVAVMRLQGLGPKAGQTVPMNADPQAITFHGDVTDMFSAGSNVVIAKLLPSSDGDADDQNRYIAVLGADDSPALLNVDSVSYSAGPNETTLTLDNPDTVDLAAGVGTNDLNDNLRVIPFDYVAKARTDSGSYETMPLDGLHIYDGSVSLPGEDHLAALGTIVESSDKLDAKMSPNKQFGFARVYRDTTGDDTFEFFYTINRGKSWVSMGTKDADREDEIERAGAYEWLNHSQLAVANNGKVFCTYAKNRGDNFIGVYGVETDLAVPSPSLRDVEDSGFFGGSTVGRIMADGVHSIGYLAADLEDMSFIAISTHHANGDNYVSWYENEDNVKGDDSSPNFKHKTASTPLGGSNYATNVPGHLQMTGTSGSHRTHMFVRRVDNDDLQYGRFDEGTVTAAQTLTVNGNGAPLSSRVDGETLYVMWDDTGGGNGIRFGTIDNVATGTAAVGTQNTIVNSTSEMNHSRNNGVNGAVSGNIMRTIDTLIRVNPADENHVMAVAMVDHPDASIRPHLFEILDITDYAGVQHSDYNGSSAGQAVGNATVNIDAVQNFNASSTRVRTVAVRATQTGTIPQGSTLSCYIFTSDGSVPTGGAPVATALNTVDASKISTSASGQWIFFNFDDSAVENLSGNHAFVVRWDQAPDASNFINLWRNTSTQAIGSRGNGEGDDVTWTSSAGTIECEINGEWVEDVGLGNQFATTTPDGNVQHAGEVSIDDIDDDYLQLLWRARLGSTSFHDHDYAGWPYRRTVEWRANGAGDNKAIVSSAAIAGFDTDFVPEVDESVVLNVAFQAPDSQRLVADTGANHSDSNADQDASGYNRIVQTRDFGSAVIDSDFQEGVARDFNGSSNLTAYSDSVANDFNSGKDFAIEAEIKMDTATTGIIVGKGSSSTDRWQLFVTGSGEIEFLATDGSLVFTITDTGEIALNTYYKIRAVYNASTGKMKLYKSTDGNTFTDLTLVNDDTYTGNYGLSGHTYVGRQPDTASAFFNGKIGYLKIAKNFNGVMDLSNPQDLTAQGPFAYAGFKGQQALIGIQNLGVGMVAQRVLGIKSQASYSNASGPFMRASFINGTANAAAMKDSYDVQAYYDHSLANSGNLLELRLELNRKSGRDQSSIPGINFVFSKV